MCGCASVDVRVCGVFFAHLFRELGGGGWRWWAVSIKPVSPSSKGNWEVRPGGPLVGAVSVLGRSGHRAQAHLFLLDSSVLQCPKCWRASVYIHTWALPNSEVIVEGCLKFVF